MNKNTYSYISNISQTSFGIYCPCSYTTQPNDVRKQKSNKKKKISAFACNSDCIQLSCADTFTAFKPQQLYMPVQWHSLLLRCETFWTKDITFAI